MSKNKALIFSAPSGAGKTTIVKKMLEVFPQLSFSISACSRAPRKNETHARDYYFLSTEAFQQKIKEDAFLEWEEVYPGNYYGTLKSEVDRIWAEGKQLIFDVDVVGGINIKKYFGEKALSFFIMPPSIEELEKRLQTRSTDDEETIQKRIEKAEYELGFAPQFDIVIINDQLDKAVQETEQKIRTFNDTK